MISLQESYLEKPGIGKCQLSVKINEDLMSKTKHSLALARNHAFDLMLDNHWYGELISNVTTTAEHIFFLQSLNLDLNVDREAYRRYLLSEQNPDGSWSIAPDYPGDVSTSAEAYLALKILGVSVTSPQMKQAQSLIVGVGGLAKVRVFTRLFFAQFGLFPWDAVPQLQTEFILMPSQSPVNLYTLSSWARSTTVPLLLIRHHQPMYALPNGLSSDNDFLDELWLDADRKNKVVPYSPNAREYTPLR